MARRRYRRREEGLLELAARSDWKLSAGLAAGCLIAAVVVIPGLFAGAGRLLPLGMIFVPLAWLFAFVFACIAVVRYMKQFNSAGAASASQGALSRPRRPGSERTAVPLRLVPSASDGDPASSVAARVGKPWVHAISTTARPRPQRPESWSADVLDRVEWKRFEDLCCAFYREKGIRAETTRLGADGGIDIHLFQDETAPARVTAIVQCKAWNKPVGVKEVRELRGVMAHEKVEKAFFMAPNGYTNDARAFAVENRITLLDGKLFLAMLQRLPEDASKRLLDFATVGDWTTPTCPNCGAKMADRAGKRGRFWGCSTYPKCQAKLPMRAAAMV